MNTISREAEISFEIKRSRFIGRSFKAGSSDEALGTVKNVRAEYADATHHCWAFRIGMSGEQARYDNSGEPQGTAGPPILDAIRHKDLTNTLVVVTRYYGGTKLGAGGLVRAYGEAAKKVLEESGLTELRSVVEIRVPVPYNLLAPLEAYLMREGDEVVAREFGEQVLLLVRVPVEREPAFRAYYDSLVGGRIEYAVLAKKQL
jgi:uncharacterized YigZ family protein